MTTIDFYFDFLSPYAYLARHELARIAADSGASIAHKPIDLGRAKLAIGNNGPSNRSLPVKLAYLHTDLRRWAQRYGIPFGGIKNHESERLNIGTFFCRDEHDTAAYVQHTFHLLWGIGAAPDDEATLRQVARSMAWDEEAFLAFTCSDAGKRMLDASTDDAIAREVFGVPMMVIGEHKWWGNDRVFMVDEYLKSA